MAKAAKMMHGDTKWFTHDRFGMFIHWGLYSQPARHEWVMHAEEITNDIYNSKYFRRFDPDLYNPDEWAEMASLAGMKYFVITTKHHEGFCLWDSKYTEFKAPNTPCGKDLLMPMIEAFRKRGMGIGLYHSLIDWNHPQFEIDSQIGPYRNLPAKKMAQMNKKRNQAKYAEYLHNQTRELLTNFGKIDILWYDFSYKAKGRDAWQSEKLVKLIRELQPDIILDDRLDLPGSGDIKTPEQVQPREWVKVDGKPVVWEACQTFSGSWGYHRDEHTWRDTDELVRTLIDCVSKGGNLLLNVGPTARGEFDDRAKTRLKGMGEWMRRHSRSIYGCTQAPAEFKCPEHCRLTYNPEKKRLYVHVFAWPHKILWLDGKSYQKKVEYAQLLNDASEVKLGAGSWEANQIGACSSLGLNLPIMKPNVTVPVIELFLK